LAPFFRLGIGAVVGSGRQYISWIHMSDLIDAIIFLLNNESASGAYNMCAPNPVTNKDFSNRLAESFGRRCFLRIPEFVLRIFLGEVSSLASKGQRAIPCRLKQAGYKFKYEYVKTAFLSLLAGRKR
jgi:uncharacterized protein (TIGR01777 family)